MNQVQKAIGSNLSTDEVAKAAVRDAVEGASSDQEKEALALALYKEATGRFPQGSSDRRAVYTGGFVLVGVVFLVIAVAVVVLALNKTTIPESLTVLATALVSGVIGGLFGYAQQ